MPLQRQTNELFILYVRVSVRASLTYTFLLHVNVCGMKVA